MIDSSTHVASTPGIMLLRVGQAGTALRWDPAGRCWRWPDPQGGQLYAWPAPAGMPSGQRLQENACVLACCTSGRVLLGQGKRLGMVELPAPGQASRPLQSQVLLTVDAAEPRTSISDGCTDRGGNFVFGTANTASDQRPIGSFYQYSHQHGLRRLALPVVVKAGGIAFSTDGRRMYFADTAQGDIMQCEYDSERAKVSNVKTFAPVLARGAGAAVVDSGDRLWSVQGGALVQYAPHGGALRRIGMAREAAAGVAFGGEGLRQLLVLGANGGLYGLPPDLAPDSPADLARHPSRGVPDVPFDDGGAARFAVLPGPAIGD
ncbi:Sugar lactone lactonase YvrE [Duganella sp. CF517]|uniref:SMP-30/gluconolactonase/LRE family protein n=1 Tax=Duganella sp. CF517 TaxID=1881038 RepID=UPI0008BC17CB|nr:SMP-30/gluconolactonase/LRE family protein [Duganella sp. CF517]SEO18152.1 Sugar lactone lactonase YvrE [Duganella sp. CF517]